MKDFNYAPAPFWLLNHRLEREEMARQIRLIKESGASGFFLHSRDGLLTPYGSKEWFACMKFAVDEAKKAGLKAWLYDEDAWPSGNAGGLITAQYPEFIAKSLVIRKLVPDAKGRIAASLGQGRIFAALELLKDAQGKVERVEDIAGEIGTVRTLFLRGGSSYNHVHKTNDFKHIRASSFYPDLRLEHECASADGRSVVYVALIAPFDNNNRFEWLVDNLNSACVGKYLELTHERYAAVLREDFGDAVPGIFTDEPYAGKPPWADSNPPWTEEVEPLFQERNGHPLKEVFPHLVDNLDDRSRRVRKDYWGALNTLFERNFFAQTSRWCEANHLQFCGHMINEEDPAIQAKGCGNVFKCMKHFHIPSFDHVTTVLANREHPGLNFGGKLVSSAASWYAKPTVLCECFAISHFNLTPFEMRKIASWLFSLGTTWLVPAQFHYSYDGYRKDDAGKSFFFQDPDFKKFPAFAKFAGNLGRKLAAGRHEAKTILVCPYELFLEFAVVEQPLAEKLRAKLFELMTAMMEAHIEFDIVDDGELLATTPENGRIRAGYGEFASLVLPRIEEMEQSYLDKFRRFADNGVRVFVNPKIEEVAAVAVSTEIEGMEGGDVSNLYSRRLKDGDRSLVFLFDNSPRGAKFRLRVPAGTRQACVYDPNSDKRFRLAIDEEGWTATAIQGYTSLLLEFSNTALDVCGTWEESACLDAPDETPLEWNYVPPVEGLAVALHTWDVELKGAGLDLKRRAVPFCLLRDLAGTQLGYIAERHMKPGMDQAEVIHRSFKARYATDFDLEEAGDYLLLFEGETFAGDFTLEVNGVEIDQNLFKRSRVYDFNNRTIPVKLAKRNTIRVTWENGKEFDGIRSALYVVKDDGQDLTLKYDLKTP